MSRERAEGALLGLAAGDAASYAALNHRLGSADNYQLGAAGQIRGAIRRFDKQLDDQRVNKRMMPFTLSLDPAIVQFCATDDAEQAAITALALLKAKPDPSASELFDTWLSYVTEDPERTWLSVADRAAVVNAGLGMCPPQTGSDNPHLYDDSSVVRAVPVGVRWAGDPITAATIAARVASATNAEVGVESARVMAATIAHLIATGDIGAAITSGRAQLSEDSWLTRGIDRAFAILEEERSAFAAVPRWSNEIVSPEYSFGNIAAETLPLALAISASTHNFSEGLGLATMIPKLSDTLPALVGALHGARQGMAEIPETWRSRADILHGVCIPSVAGQSMRHLASMLWDERSIG
ncbi:ADP-ribosylglycohydrolase family protein [Clavibacter michiganensis subsp. phaseoli]|uniref:ADP-ribosylglycohydrolase family protein n=1 Tax=Clavibacter phaseoli TaxID=1734031 RepID=A0A8I0SMZ1_9MICO|nr:ADP-ribosylglycohydrolase family protein [Clavibacter phaseoli]MBF4632714.1 ADP-ribosylglycohydrolase family protein [Clavibacter phaseoli]